MQNDHGYFDLKGAFAHPKRQKRARRPFLGAILAATLVLTTALPSSAQATTTAPQIDRRPLVQAAFEALPHLLKFIVDQKSFNDMPVDKKEIFQHLLLLAQSHSIPLIFSSEPKQFDIHPGEPTRLMGTNATGPVFVNLHLLNDPKTHVDFLFLAKLLTHELGHHIPGADQGLRDRVSQDFEDLLRPYQREESLNGDRDIEIFSLPVTKIEATLDTSDPDTLQPSFYVFLKSAAGVQDLTPEIRDNVIKSTSGFRPMWSLINDIMYGVMSMMKDGFMKVAPVFDGLVHGFSAMFGKEAPAEDLSSSLNKMNGPVHMMKFLEIYDAQFTPLGDAHNGFLRLKATYSTVRALRQQVTITANGLAMEDEYPIAVNISGLVPANSSDKRPSLQIQLRPQNDLDATAKIKSVNRRNGRMESLVLSLHSAKEVHTVHLISQYEEGLLYFPLHVEKISSSEYRATFIPDWMFDQIHHRLVSDSVLVNSEKAVDLDRLIELNGSTQEAPIPDDISKVDLHNVGLWALKDQKPYFMTEFSYQKPTILFDLAPGSEPVIQPSHLVVEFQTAAGIKIRQVRLHLARTLMLAKESEKENGQKSQVIEMTIDGKRRRLGGEGGKIAEQKNLYEIVSFDPKEIGYRHGDGPNSQRVFAQTAIPYKFAREEATTSDNVDMIPMVHPLMLEIVTDQLQTLRYYFKNAIGDISCEDILKQKFDFKTTPQNSN